MRARTLSTPESGGITILVALMLLVLLTVAAVGMSKNSFRQVVIAGTARQAATVINTADTGLEWSTFWIHQDNQVLGAPGTGATSLIHTFATLNSDPTLAGKVQVVPPAGEMISAADPITGAVKQFGLRVTYMGQVDPPGTSVVLPALWPQVWSIRSDAQLIYPGGLTYQHSREMWLTKPIPVAGN